MLKIKLARFGKKNQPHFRMVVNEARDKRDGSYVALVGHYAPAQDPKVLDINVEAYDSWIKKGAQPTDTVGALYERYKSGNPFPSKKARLSRKAKAKLEAAAEAKASEEAEKAKAAEEAKKAKEAPAAEVKAEEPKVEEKSAEAETKSEETKA